MLVLSYPDICNYVCPRGRINGEALIEEAVSVLCQIRKSQSCLSGPDVP